MLAGHLLQQTHGPIQTATNRAVWDSTEQCGTQRDVNCRTDSYLLTSTSTSSCCGLMVVLPFVLLPSPPEDPVGVGSEWGVEGVVGRCVWGDSTPIDIGEAEENANTFTHI